MQILSGFLVVDKPQGWTSFDVVAKLRKLTGISRIGHLGTLDPLATGVLVVAIGEGTKLIEYFMGVDKVYEVAVEIGKISDTYDREGKVTQVNYDPAIFSEEKLQALLPTFCGNILQVPPAYSAIKVQGRSAYALARAGKVVDLKPRRVRIDELTLLAFTPPTFSLRVKCGSGTYIRSLVHDLGQRLGCGAVMTALRRTSVGPFSLEVALPVDSPLAFFWQALISLEQMVQDWPSASFDARDASRLRQGQTFPCPLNFPSVHCGQPVAAFHDDSLIALVACDAHHHVKVLKNLLQ